jgi:hypothetical protein
MVDLSMLEELFGAIPGPSAAHPIVPLPDDDLPVMVAWTTESNAVMAEPSLL